MPDDGVQERPGMLEYRLYARAARRSLRSASSECGCVHRPLAGVTQRVGRLVPTQGTQPSGTKLHRRTSRWRSFGGSVGRGGGRGERVAAVPPRLLECGGSCPARRADHTRTCRQLHVAVFFGPKKAAAVIEQFKLPPTKSARTLHLCAATYESDPWWHEFGIEKGCGRS